MTIYNNRRTFHCVDLSVELTKGWGMPVQRKLSLLKSLRFAVITALLTLSGCGGGGGGGGGSSASAQPAPTPSEPQTPVESYTMDDLVVPDDFDYSSVDDFDIDIDISHISTERSFVNIYSRYTTRTDSTFKPDYSSKVMAGSLKEGVFTSNFTAPLSYESYLVEISFYDNQPSLQQVVSSGDSEIVW